MVYIPIRYDETPRVGVPSYCRFDHVKTKQMSKIVKGCKAEGGYAHEARSVRAGYL